MSNPDIRTGEKDLAPIFAALGDPTRLSILSELSDGKSRSIAGLAEGSALTRQAVTKHLRVLEKAELVTCNRVGRESRYRFRPEPVGELKTYLDNVSRQWDDALERLRSFVET